MRKLRRTLCAIIPLDKIFPTPMKHGVITVSTSLPSSRNLQSLIISRFRRSFAAASLRPNEITALEKWIRGRAIRNGLKVGAGFLEGKPPTAKRKDWVKLWILRKELKFPSTGKMERHLSMPKSNCSRRITRWDLRLGRWAMGFGTMMADKFERARATVDTQHG